MLPCAVCCVVQTDQTVRVTSLTDIKFIYIIFMYLVLLLFYLTTERSMFHQSCQLPDFLATASCRDTFLCTCSELNTFLRAMPIGFNLFLLQAPTSEKLARFS